MITGNKGEWSEIYVLLKLLADGKLYAANENLERIESIFFPIIRILRNEKNDKREFLINGEIIVIDGDTNGVIARISTAQFIVESKKLFTELKSVQGRSFSFPETEQFLNEISVHCLTSTTRDKSDIKMVVHDLNTGSEPTLGFSIKSMLGSKSTLFNAGNGTNFVYEIEGLKATEFEPNEINNITQEPKIASRINRLTALGLNLRFVKIQSQTLQLNLQVIDSKFPDILAKMLIYKYLNPSKSNMEDLIEIIEKNNPLNFNIEQGHTFYRQKIKNFLTDSAMGLTPETVWTGTYNATGGIIVVKPDGDLVCYHIYNRNQFQEYLIKNTRFEQASTERYGFGDVYIENGKKYIKLNLQIRFTN